MVAIPIAMLCFAVLVVFYIVGTSIYDVYRYRSKTKKIKSQYHGNPPDTQRTLRNLQNIVNFDKSKECSDWENAFKRLEWDTMTYTAKVMAQRDNAHRMIDGLPLEFASEEAPWNPTVAQMESLGALETHEMVTITGEVVLKHHQVRRLAAYAGANSVPTYSMPNTDKIVADSIDANRLISPVETLWYVS